MFKRRTVIGLASLVIVLIASFAPPSATHAADNWYVYLYNGQAGELMRVSLLDASTELYSLGIDSSDNVFLNGNSLSFSPDGSQVAFCMVDHVAQSPSGYATLVLRDLAAATNLLELDLGEPVGCQAGAFDATNARLTVSVVNYVPGDPRTDLDGVPMWQLLVIDLASGTVIHELNADSPPVATAGMMIGTPLMPEVRVFSGESITFAEVPWGIGGAGGFQAYAWNLADDTVTPVDFWGHTGIETLPYTGEMIWLDHDPSLPAPEMGGPFGAFNVVMLRDTSGETRPIYHESEWTLSAARFINGGAQIALYLYPPYADMMAVQDGGTAPPVPRWVALNRDGSTSDLNLAMDFVDVFNAPGGYLAFQAFYGDDVAPPAFTLTYYVADSATEVWHAAGTPGWELVWTSPVPPETGLRPFVSFTP